MARPPEAGPQLTQPTHTWDRDGVYTVRASRWTTRTAARSARRRSTWPTSIPTSVTRVEIPADIYEHGLDALPRDGDARRPRRSDPVLRVRLRRRRHAPTSCWPNGEGHPPVPCRRATSRARSASATPDSAAASAPRRDRARDDALRPARGDPAVGSSPSLDDAGDDRRGSARRSRPTGQPTLSDWVDPRPLGRGPRGYHGNTLVALDELSFRISRAQGVLPAFGDLLWVVTRPRSTRRSTAVSGPRSPQLVRAERSRIVVRADAFLAAVAGHRRRGRLRGPRVTGVDEAYLVRDVLASLQTAWFHLEYADYEQTSTVTRASRCRGTSTRSCVSRTRVG
jgi:hypothetical protein